MLIDYILLAVEPPGTTPAASSINGLSEAKGTPHLGFTPVVLYSQLLVKGLSLKRSLSSPSLNPIPSKLHKPS